MATETEKARRYTPSVLMMFTCSCMPFGDNLEGTLKTTQRSSFTHWTPRRHSHKTRNQSFHHSERFFCWVCCFAFLFAEIPSLNVPKCRYFCPKLILREFSHIAVPVSAGHERSQDVPLDRSLSHFSRFDSSDYPMLPCQEVRDLLWP